MCVWTSPSHCIIISKYVYVLQIKCEIKCGIHQHHVPDQVECVVGC